MEKSQAFNPYLPGYEYIPDGEPHVFGDRVIIIKPSKNWMEFMGNITIDPGVHPLFFCYQGRGKIDFLEFNLIQTLKLRDPITRI